jgi:uncharacterized protein DUF6186
VTRAVTLSGYVVIIGVAVGYEVTGRIWRRTPTIADIVALLGQRHATRWLILVTWLWVGWHLFVRTHH